MTSAQLTTYTPARPELWLRLEKYDFHGLSYAYILGAVYHHLQNVRIASRVGRDRGGALAGHDDGADGAEQAAGATRSGMVDPPLVFQ
ncbi:hypothetical protein OBBRIDRAFT_891846 [Obba rivulosa]|uniref:Uncharacterized protein n=1 Tax=Obba rivulosa TaxID=1052685 RepID=A0A8E2DG09_9APHY|nr:hypothetical protein OBBRIDRAFT_891846 [Obba rivulosa]